ncbi:MAG: hypothetical protein QXW83_02765 [Nitrososphaerales archaeon]
MLKRTILITILIFIITMIVIFIVPKSTPSVILYKGKVSLKHEEPYSYITMLIDLKENKIGIVKCSINSSSFINLYVFHACNFQGWIDKEFSYSIRFFAKNVDKISFLFIAERSGIYRVVFENPINSTEDKSISVLVELFEINLL